MTLSLSKLDKAIKKFTWPSKEWLLKRGYISAVGSTGDYQWTEEGNRWIRSLKPNEGIGDV